ncbi:hypothetical protein JNUCC23_04145 [Peribacillus sp. JNUCC 23]
MVEGIQIDWASHAFEEVVKEALKFAKKEKKLIEFSTNHYEAQIE